jgi:UDP-3-O-[3-hydroxymyristoyl] glucosamine N-acyltransferase
VAWTLGELAERFAGRLVGPAGLVVERPVPADARDRSGIAFCESRRYLAKATGVGALLLPEELSSDTVPYVQLADPRAAFGALLEEQRRPLPLGPGIHPTAVVAGTAQVDPSASVGPYVVIADGAVLGPRVRVHPFCYVGEGCTVGAGSVLWPHAVLCRDVHVGQRCTVHAGAVLGGDGFGYTREAGGWRKVPHVGDVRIGDDVDVCALASVERATCGSTVLGSGVKVGNLVQVGHNTRIGAHALLAPMSGVAGSSVLGERVVMGAQSGVSDHVTVADDVQLAGRTAVLRSIPRPGVYSGLPTAGPLERQQRVRALLPRLGELFERVRQLEKSARRDGPPGRSAGPEQRQGRP